MPAVSVIVPVYNVEPYIARCVRSLFGQTLRDMEFIFVDDCSEDKSVEIVSQVLEEEFPSRIPQVRFSRMPQNSGIAKVRMHGVSLCTGEYITHCDSDDEVEQNAYSLMYEKAIEGNYDIVTCDFRMLGLKSPRIQSQACEPGHEICSILSGKVWGTIWCRLYRRELWDNLITPQGDMWEDMVLSVQAISRSKSFGYLPIPLYNYYRRASSISFEAGLQADLKRWESIYSNARIVVDFLAENQSVMYSSEDMVSFKYRCRSSLVPYVHIPKYYGKWRNTSPEIDRSFLRTHGISFETKFWFIMIHLRLYHSLKKITGLFRK